MADITSTTGTSIPPKSVEPTVDPKPVTNPKPVINPPPGYPDLRPVQPVYRVPATQAIPAAQVIPASQVILVTQTPPEPQGKPYIQSRPSFNPYKAIAEAQAQESPQPQNQPTEAVAKEPTRVPQNKFPTDLVYNEQKEKNNNGWNPGRFIKSIFSTIRQFFHLIKNILLTAFILFFLTVIALFLIVEYKPPVFWNPLKTFLNAGIDFTAIPKVPSADIYSRINNAALNNQPVELNNNELTQLVRDYNLLGDMSVAESFPNGMRFYINIDTPERPLWLIVETQINQYNKFAISKVGFGRLSAPSQLTGLFNDTLGQAFQFLESQVTSDSATSAVKLFLDTGKINKDLTLNRVEFKEGSVVLSYQHNSTGSSGLTY